MRLAHVRRPLLAMAACLIVAAALAATGSSRSPITGHLLVDERKVRSGEVYIEGAVQYLTIRDLDRGLERTRPYADGIRVDEHLEVGSYRLISYTRPGRGTADESGPAINRCSEGFELRRRPAVSATVVTKVARRCRISFAVSADGPSRADWASARDLRRYLRESYGPGAARRPAPWYDELRAIRVSGGAARVETDLGDGEAARRHAGQICAGIEESRSVDSASGHTVLGARRRVLARCQPHTD